MSEISLDITEEILVQLKPKDLTRYKSVCKSWNSLISSDRFVKSHLTYNLKKKARNNNETGDTRIVLAGPSSSDYKCDIVGSSNGLVCVRYMTELLVVNPSTREVIKLESPPQIPDRTTKLPYHRLGFGYDSSIDDYKVVVGFQSARMDKYRFLVLTLKSNRWRSVVGELDSDYMFIEGFLINGVIHRLAFNDQNNNGIVESYDIPKEVFKATCGILCNGAIHWIFYREYKLVIVSFDLSKEVFKEIPTPIPVPLPLTRYATYTLGTTKDRLCFLFGYSKYDRQLWVKKNNKLQESESIWERFIYISSCDDCSHQFRKNHIPCKSFSGHINISMIEEDSGAPVFVQSVRSPNGKARIWLSKISDNNHKYDEHVFVESLVSPHGMGNDNGNCNDGRVTMSIGGRLKRKRKGSETNSNKTLRVKKADTKDGSTRG